MRHRNRTVHGIVATQPLTESRGRHTTTRLKPEPTISRYVEERISIETARDEEAMLAPVGRAILLEMQIQGHDHACVVCGRRLLDEVICPDCGTVPAWVRMGRA